MKDYDLHSGYMSDAFDGYTEDERDDSDYENRIVSTGYTPGDEDAESSLRPRRMEEYIGQDKAKENLKV